jgi:hypothetical protein
MAEKLLRDKQFALAVECSERALEVLPDNREFQAIRAKAKMLMERKTPDQRSIIFQQQDRNKDCGLAIPDSDTDRSAPVTDDLEMIKSTPAKTTNEISDGLLTPLSDIHDGEILEQRGKLDEALVVYRRCI